MTPRKVVRHGNLGIGKVAAVREHRAGEGPRGRQTLVYLEADGDGRSHLDGGDAHLTVALREMRIARRKQRPLNEHRKQQFGAFSELFDVEVSAVFARRNGAQPFDAATTARHRAGLSRRHNKGAGVKRALLALGPFLELLRRRRHAGDAHERSPGNAYSGDFRRRRPTMRIFQCTTNGLVMMSRRKPMPGMMTLNAVGCGTMSRNSTSSMSAGSAPLTKTGPVSGCTRLESRCARSAALVWGST
jgi:hypothetical protein